MSKRIYPRKVWVLMPSFKPVEIEVVKPYGARASQDFGDLTEKGKHYPVAAMHETKAEAIQVGRWEVERLRAGIAKRTETMNKRIAALDKAERNNP